MTDQLFQTGSLLWLDVALKSSLLLAVTHLAALLLRRTSAAMQHRVWVLCFAACLFVPVISIAVPGWTLPVVAQSWLNNETASATEVTVPSLMHPPVDVSSLTSDFSLPNAWPRGDESGVAQSLSHEGDRFLSPVLPVTTSGDVRDSAGTTPLATSRSGVATLSNVSWVAVGLVIWTVGVALCLLRTLWQYRSMQRVKRQCMETSQPEWLKLRDDAASAIGLTRAVRLFHCEEARTPMVVGVWRPMILLPRDAENWNTAHRRSVLLHELGHIQRHDVATQSLAGFVCALHWFNPLAWYGLAQMRKLRELACDDLVLACGQPPAEYADVLLDVARSYRHHSLAMAVGMARSSNVEHRILAILDRARNHMTLTPRTARLSLLTAIALVLLIGSMRLETRANPPAETTIDETSTQLAQATGDTNSQQPEVAPAIETTQSNAGLPEAVQPVESERRGKRLIQIGTDNLRTNVSVSDIAFTPDGQQIAAGQQNGEWPRIHLFDISTGRRANLITVEEGPHGWVRCISISADGTRLLWGEAGGAVALWDLVNDRLLFREKLHRRMVHAVTFAHHKDWFASCGADSVVQVREVTNPSNEIQTIATAVKPDDGGDFVHSTGINCLTFSVDDHHLFAGDPTTGNVLVFNVEKGDLVEQIANPTDNEGISINPLIQIVTMSRDGSFLMAAGQRTVKREETSLKYGGKNVSMSEVRLWDPATGELIRELHGREDHGFGYAVLSPDGKKVAVGDFSRLRIIDADSGDALQTVELPGWWGSAPEFSPNGQLVAVAIQNSIGVFEVQSGKRLHHQPDMPIGLITSAAWSARGDRIVTGHGDGFIRVWDAETGNMIWRRELAPVISRSGWNASPYFVGFTGNGRSVIAAGRRDDPVKYERGVVLVCDSENGDIVMTTGSREIRNAVLSPDNERLIVATSKGSGGDTRFEAVQLDTGDVFFSVPPEFVKGAFESCETMCVRPDTRMLMVALEDGQVVGLDSLTGEEQHRFTADWLEEGQRFTARGRPKQPRMWEADFSADGKTLVSSANEYVYVWDVETGVMRLRVRHPHDHGCRLAVSPNGKWIATSDLLYSNDYGTNTIRLYDIETGHEVMQVEPDDKRAIVLSFSPDSKKLLAGYDRGSADIWNINP